MKKLTFKLFAPAFGRAREEDVVRFINENDIKQEDILKLTIIQADRYALFYDVLIEE